MRYVTRTEWEAKPAKGVAPFTQKLGFAVHWVGGYVDLPNFEAAKAHVRSIQLDHLQGRNSDGIPWQDVAYNALVWENVAFEGRGWDHKNAANGDAVHNGQYYAICVLIGPGNTFSDKAKDTLSQLTALGRQNYGFGFETWPHSHFIQTQCPGDDIRAWIAAGQPSSTTPQAPQEDDMADQTTSACMAPSKLGRWVLDRDGSVRTYNFDDSKPIPFHGSMFEYPDEQSKPGRYFVDIEPAGPNDSDGYFVIANDGFAGKLKK